MSRRQPLDATDVGGAQGGRILAAATPSDLGSQPDVSADGREYDGRDRVEDSNESSGDSYMAALLASQQASHPHVHPRRSAALSSRSHEHESTRSLPSGNLSPQERANRRQEVAMAEQTTESQPEAGAGWEWRLDEPQTQGIGPETQRAAGIMSRDRRFKKCGGDTAESATEEKRGPVGREHGQKERRKATISEMAASSNGCSVASAPGNVHSHTGASIPSSSGDLTRILVPSPVKGHGIATASEPSSVSSFRNKGKQKLNSEEEEGSTHLDLSLCPAKHAAKRGRDGNPLQSTWQGLPANPPTPSLSYKDGPPDEERSISNSSVSPKKKPRGGTEHDQALTSKSNSEVSGVSSHASRHTPSRQKSRNPFASDLPPSSRLATGVSAEGVTEPPWSVYRREADTPAFRLQVATGTVLKKNQGSKRKDPFADSDDEESSAAQDSLESARAPSGPTRPPLSTEWSTSGHDADVDEGGRYDASIDTRLLGNNDGPSSFGDSVSEGGICRRIAAGEASLFDDKSEDGQATPDKHHAGERTLLEIAGAGSSQMGSPFHIEATQVIDGAPAPSYYQDIHAELPQGVSSPPLPLAATSSVHSRTSSRRDHPGQQDQFIGSDHIAHGPGDGRVPVEDSDSLVGFKPLGNEGRNSKSQDSPLQKEEPAELPSSPSIPLRLVATPDGCGTVGEKFETGRTVDDGGERGREDDAMVLIEETREEDDIRTDIAKRTAGSAGGSGATDYEEPPVVVPHRKADEAANQTGIGPASATTKATRPEKRARPAEKLVVEAKHPQSRVPNLGTNHDTPETGHKELPVLLMTPKKTPRSVEAIAISPKSSVASGSCIKRPAPNSVAIVIPPSKRARKTTTKAQEAMEAREAARPSRGKGKGKTKASASIAPSNAPAPNQTGVQSNSEEVLPLRPRDVEPPVGGLPSAYDNASSKAGAAPARPASPPIEMEYTLEPRLVRGTGTVPVPEVRRVWAYWVRDGRFYPGTIQALRPDRVEVEFDDVCYAEVPLSFLRLCRVNKGDCIYYCGSEMESQQADAVAGTSRRNPIDPGSQLKRVIRAEKAGTGGDAEGDLERDDIIIVCDASADPSDPSTRKQRLMVEAVCVPTTGKRLSEEDLWDRVLSEEQIQFLMVAMAKMSGAGRRPGLKNLGELADQQLREDRRKSLPAPPRKATAKAGLLPSGSQRPSNGTHAVFKTVGIIFTTPEVNGKQHIEKRIRSAGGTIIEEPDEIFVSDNVDTDGDEDSQSIVKIGFRDSPLAVLDLIILVSEQPRKTFKYLMALALGIPCVSVRWIDACWDERRLVDWVPYMMGAGASADLGCHTLGLQAKLAARHKHDLVSISLAQHELRLFIDASFVCVCPSEAKFKLTPQYGAFLRAILTAMGATRVDTATSLAQYGTTKLSRCDYVVWPDKFPKGQQKLPKGTNSRVRMGDFEWIKQCLIAGRKLDAKCWA